ncbi:NRT1-PTR FAMILY 2-5 protein [Nymphaea thermarum]|nr:NRT1-PTR FAMILY 2-5 protein [Nymphaea thermarum]
MASLDEGSLVPALAIEMPNENVVQTSSKKGGGWVTAPFLLGLQHHEETSRRKIHVVAVVPFAGSSLASSITSYGVTIDLLQFLVLRFNISNIRASQITNIINSVTSLSPVAGAVLWSSLASSIASYGVTIDLLQFLVRRFNISNIRASQITNIINSVTYLSPVAGAVLCDSYLGNFLTISVFTFISCLGTLMLALAAWLPSMAPPFCVGDGQLGSCQPPSPTQFAFLRLAFSVTTLGGAGTWYTYVTIGANQFDRKKEQERFVSYYFITTTVSTLIPSTVIVYVMDNVGWNWGYGLCAVLSAISLALFLPVKWFCRDARPEGSPFINLARVVVSAARKIKLRLSVKEEDYCHGSGKHSNLTDSLSLINKAALITGGDTHSDGSIAKRWRLCTIQEVEDLKTLIWLFPLWSTGIYLNIATAVQTNLTILQSLAMDRSLGPSCWILYFVAEVAAEVPAASFQVFSYISMGICLPLIDRFFYPFSRLLVRRPLTLLHRIGVGHVLVIVGLAAMACVEARRLQVMHQRGLAVAGDHLDAFVPMSALWLVLPLAILGASSAFYLPDQVSLYYQEFPASLKNVGTSVCLLAVGIGYYLSTTLVHAVQKVTPWLTDDINSGRVDNVYWILAGLEGLNFLYYVLCAKLYKLQSSG